MDEKYYWRYTLKLIQCPELIHSCVEYWDTVTAIAIKNNGTVSAMSHNIRMLTAALMAQTIIDKPDAHIIKTLERLAE